MRLRASRLPAFLCGLALCSVSCMPEGEAEPVRGDFVISRFAVDPATQLGQLFLREPPTEMDRLLVVGIEETFDVATCWANQSLAVRIDATRTGARGAGTASLLLVSGSEEGDLCAAGRSAFVLPSSFRPEAPSEPHVMGPLFLEGQTLEARLSLGDVGRVALQDAEFLPRWWSLRATFMPLPGGGLSISEAEASSTWGVAEHLRRPVINRPEVRYLDELVRLNFQPDLDVDGDGLEQMRDTDRDGRVDLCIDGPAAPEPREWEGDDCMGDPRFADGYHLQLRFRLYPVTLTD